MNETELTLERLALAKERISVIGTEHSVKEPFGLYFKFTAGFIERLIKLEEDIEQGCLMRMTLEQLQQMNYELYKDILEEHYEESYGNPKYAVEKLGDEYGKMLCFLYAEIRGMIVYAFENRKLELTLFAELFIEIYNEFENFEELTPKAVRDIIYWFMSDNSDILVRERIMEQIDSSRTFAEDLICKSDLSDLRYLYYFGEYISENEWRTAQYLNTLPEEKIDQMADTFTEGYRIGFVRGNKDLSKKKTVNIRYTLGFERVIKKAVENFGKMGLKPTIFRAAVSSVNKRQQAKIGYYGGIPNKQFDYDHRSDEALYFDKQFVERKLSVLKNTYEEHKEMAALFAGPACMEVFGEIPFAPEAKKEALTLSEKQEELSVYYSSRSGQIVNEYIRGDERSFTIIAFPIPAIGAQFEEIFNETIKINTLDYKLYESIQQVIIDALDEGEFVHIKGKGKNRTDLMVHLHPLTDAESQTIFENCVADVNIPVGEVFTSPVLEGTKGILHVTEVYLNELKYIDLQLEFIDGKVASYSCKNFEQEEENKKLIKDNLLYHHDTLPMGEFAIGTNTTAYVMAEKYQIAEKLPILIAEKMGPHFAVGDTCYSFSEDNRVYNPDGKEIVAKDNACSILRKSDMEKAYFQCHTDITIPYEELGEICVVKKDKTRKKIIENGKFVLPGTEALNEPFEG